VSDKNSTTELAQKPTMNILPPGERNFNRNHGGLEEKGYVGKNAEA
jgi:hypothetical protein